MTPMKAIRAKCLDCCGGSAKEVRTCTAPECPLFPYRFGHRPETSPTPGTGEFGEKSEASPAKEAGE